MKEISEKLQLKENKILKLTNVLCCKCDINSEDLFIDIQLEQIQSYIKAKGAVQIGPLIQYIEPKVNDQGELEVEMSFLLQCSQPIHKIEEPYKMVHILCVPNCIYCRYIGPEEVLKFAYDKINLYAFENNIKLKGNSYTIFVDQNEEEGTMIADVFMERDDVFNRNYLLECKSPKSLYDHRPGNRDKFRFQLCNVWLLGRNRKL